MASISYQVQTKKNPSFIYLRLLLPKRCDIKVRTNFVIDPENWSKSKKSIKSTKTPELKKLKGDLEELKLRVLNELNASALEENIDRDWLNKVININNVSEDKSQDLLAFCNYFIEDKKSTSRKRTIQQYSLLRDNILEFCTYKNKEPKIEDVDIAFQTDLVRFYREEKGLNQTTIKKRISFLKTIVRHARRHGLATSTSLDDLGVKDGKVHTIYLTPEDLQKIRTANITSDALQNARKWLLLSCYLGQRGGDFLSITKSQIVKINGKSFVDLRQEKGDKPVYVYLTKEAQEILLANNGEFPRKLSTQKYNKYIKEVCKLARLDDIVFGSKINSETKRKEVGNFPKWELVTSHIGRRSFATNYYTKIPTPLLMAQTGHTTESVFLKYIGKSRTDSILALADEFDKL
ncbi:MAG: site-specific integrase [Cytophagales bacterium]|nr:site-specific integrase [Cytophagales bacterium]